MTKKITIPTYQDMDRIVQRANELGNKLKRQIAEIEERRERLSLKGGFDEKD